LHSEVAQYLLLFLYLNIWLKGRHRIQVCVIYSARLFSVQRQMITNVIQYLNIVFHKVGLSFINSAVIAYCFNTQIFSLCHFIVTFGEQWRRSYWKIDNEFESATHIYIYIYIYICINVISVIKIDYMNTLWLSNSTIHKH
jgi:hypothetical protein